MNFLKFFLCSTAVGASTLVEQLKAMTFPPAGSQQQAAPAGHTTVGEPIKLPGGGSQAISDVNETAFDGELPDLECKGSPSWLKAQEILKALFVDEAAFGIMSKEDLDPVLHVIMEVAMEEVSKASNECGLGKLMVQLLAVIASDTNGLVIHEAFKSEELTSPLLTLALDIPWESVKAWPFMGIFSQIAARRVAFSPNEAAVDGFETPEIIQYATGVSQAIVDKDWKSLMNLSQVFLEQGETLAQAAPLGYITALFVRAASIGKVPQDESTAKQSQIELVMLAQHMIKQLVRTPQDFLAILSTRWPLWGMAQVALNAISAQ